MASDPIRSLFRALRKKSLNTSDTAAAAQSRIEPTGTPGVEDGTEDYSPRDHSIPSDPRDESALGSWSAAIAKSNLQQLSIVCLSVALLGNAYFVFHKKPTIIVKPPVMVGELVIENGVPNDKWSISWALFAAQMAGNINPRNVSFVSQTVLSMLSPDLQMSFDSKIKQTVEIMRASNINQSFDVEDVKYNRKSNMVWVWGYKTTKVLSQAGHDDNADRRRWTYEFVIRLSETGMPIITHMDQYDGLPDFSRVGVVTDEGEVIPPEQKNAKEKPKK